jgi:hypothetical protein
VWSGCGIVFVTVALVSCTQGQIQQAMGNTTQNMISGPCPPGMGLLSAAPEFCLYVTELRVTHDTEADVNLTIMNRTGRTVYLSFRSASLSDSSGTKWGLQSTTGIKSGSGLETPLDPNVNSQITITFRQRGQTVSPEVTFSMTGEIMVYKADSRGEMMRQVPPIATRGFQFSGIRQGQQESVQKAATSGLQGVEQPAPMSSSTTTDSRGSERPMDAGPVTAQAPRTSMSTQQQSNKQGTSFTPLDVGLAVPNTPSPSETISTATISEPIAIDVVGLRLGMSPAEVEKVFKQRHLDNGILPSRPTNSESDRVGKTLKVFTFRDIATGQDIQIKDSEYVSQMRGFYDASPIPGAQREDIRAQFSPLHKIGNNW